MQYNGKTYEMEHLISKPTIGYRLQQLLFWVIMGILGISAFSYWYLHINLWYWLEKWLGYA